MVGSTEIAHPTEAVLTLIIEDLFILEPTTTVMAMAMEEVIMDTLELESSTTITEVLVGCLGVAADHLHLVQVQDSWEVLWQV